MSAADTLALVRSARDGDRDAWARLLERYYDRWLGRYHADLGSTIRKLYDTQDLVQSAVGDAMRDIPALESEAAFFVWVTSIIRHKLAKRRRNLRREERLESTREGEHARGPRDASPPPDRDVAEDDEYLHCLDVILELFPAHPEPMAATVLKLLDDCTVPEMAERFGKNERTVYRWLRAGAELLKERLEQ